MDRLHLRDEGAVINRDDWEKARAALYSAFARSDKIEICHNLVRTFESINPKTKYKTDFETFVKESALEDFADESTSSVTVSTMHKAKGKEFDAVFIMLENFPQRDDSDRRLLYVSMTRAKDVLSVHLNSSFLDRFSVGCLERMSDTRQYEPSAERTLLLTLKDVWLSDFAGRQNVVSGLMSGDSLYADENGCRDRDGRTVLKFSSRFRDRLAGFIGNGYSLSEAWVNFIVWWKGDGMDRELKVVLPGLKIIKS